MRRIGLLILLTAITITTRSQQNDKRKTTNNKQTFDRFNKKLYDGMAWRSIGPWRSGRCLAVTGVQGNPLVYYAGQVGGGVWKTVDAGNTWLPVSDSNFTSSSVGALAVAKNNTNIVYAGMGEVEMRSNVSFGDGVYRSTDAGKSWKHIGLEKTNAIGTIVTDPHNDNIVYVAAMGKIFAPNKERGLYRSMDGGATFKNILFVDDSTGCADIKMDPTNPLVLYATMWQAQRTPYSLISGGKGSGLYKSVDGGDTWKLISENPGLPKGLKGKIIATVSAVNPNKIWAIVENENGGVFVSNDAGNTWSVASKMNDLTQRPWYFSQIFADPKNENVLYVLNVEFFKSIDGGSSWARVNNHHGDNHDMWINPENGNNWIMGDDGGPEVTFDGGKNFSDIDLPTGQFYHVTLDNDFPFGVYGPQQDNSSIKIKSATADAFITQSDWYPVAGGEAGYIVSDPLNSDITYGGEYDGQLTTYNKKTDQYKYVSVYPEIHSGEGAIVHKYRFNWTMPIVFSPNDPKMMYTGSNILHRTTDGGQTWQDLSPDLTRHDPKTLQASGGPITLDNTGAETYATIFAIAESPVQKGLIWTGSDDGYVYVTKNDGKNWTRVNPKGLPDWALISYVEPSHYDAATCYVSATRYKVDDNTPYIFKTNDYGNTWTLITTGLPVNTYSRCVREDPNQKGILYAGTETGIYISFNDGASWQSLQLNLPNTPVHDIQIHKRDKAMVVATHGRGFWVLDDITTLYQINDQVANSKAYLYQPRFAYRTPGYQALDANAQAGTNAPNGVVIRYYLKDSTDKEVKLKFMNSRGDSIVTYSSKKDVKGESVEPPREYHANPLAIPPTILRGSPGMHSLVWNMRYADAKGDTSGTFEGTYAGPKAVPGDYKVQLWIGDQPIQTQDFKIVLDPRNTYSTTDLQEQFDLAMKIHDKQMEIYKNLQQLKSVRNQVNAFMGSFEDSTKATPYKALAKYIVDSATAIESRLYNQKIKANEDDLRYPVVLGEKLSGLKSVVMAADAKPTASMYASYNSLSQRIDVYLNAWKELLRTKVAEFNEKASGVKKEVIQVR
jgi:photosystem II stability/assembly factor-like uncharacterized protein